jgi:uncharacterized phiE125 gp8 family phage protein
VTVECIVAPTAEPVTADEAKLRLRVDSDDEIDVIEEMIVSARQTLEAYLQRSISKQTWRATLDRFPKERKITLPMPPVISVSSVGYRDTAGQPQTLAAESYRLAASDDDAVILLNDGFSWPAGDCFPASVTVEFVAGYAKPPERFRAYVMALLSIWFEDRSQQGQIPAGFAAADRIFR